MDALPRRELEALSWLFAPAMWRGGFLLARWVFLRSLGLWFLSAFYSLAFQIQGLIGPTGILPAEDYLSRVARVLPGLTRFWYAPSVLWLGAGHGALTALVVAGLVSSLALTLNLWPRLSIFVSFVLFLSFIGVAEEFASYQSDGMLLEASFLSLFFAPPGIRPGLGAADPPSRASTFLLQWEWFRIYFESGVVKLASGDTSWRDMTAMNHYYENGPLPTWLGWYVQHLPHGFHAFTAVMTLVIELGLVWLLLLPRPFRILCFFIVTPLQVGIILTANYAFLNYIVLSLGVLLLDDAWLDPRLRRASLAVRRRFRKAEDEAARKDPDAPLTAPSVPTWRLLATGLPLVVVFYVTVADFLFMGAPEAFSFLTLPVHALEPFRIANRYGLFAVMTPERFEIEFQGSNDGAHWTPYPFRYKPQALDEPPGIYAPYQPRFEWNLWFASLGGCRGNGWVQRAEQRLADGDESVLSLFQENPFPEGAPRYVRTIVSQYWFTDMATKRETGKWWRRDEIGPYCGTVRRRGPPS
jgi:lipase maturation factor 1